MIKINGAKGVTLLSFAVIAALFGVAFLSPWAIIPPPPPGLVLLNSWVPLEVWGGAWWVAAVWLGVGAFREDQSKALVPFAAMLFVWSASYAFAAADEYLRSGYTITWFPAALFMALLAGCFGIARLVNAPPNDLDALTRRVLGDDEGRT